MSYLPEVMLKCIFRLTIFIVISRGWVEIAPVEKAYNTVDSDSFNGWGR